ncbi:helix-turn-helix domain-containing protein [Roseomonas terrae]|jgi:AraC-like DNA-binding protein|uniref:Helix-turn-helix domain-containing protein n=1 Tax=Neoroseomonas terrae TaxID=424799 RepID=A0ABS5EDP4_9PROT|nr:helix-turn-helix domain-containing protein [Neoroseomonas terrae]MBR0649144.1 helix-turn-helix domain-containing protein [Neoroseomonas terrae]
MPISPLVFSTLSLPEAEQYEAWRTYFRPVFDLCPSGDGPTRGFEAESTTWAAGGAIFGHVRAPKLHSVRDTRRIRRDPTDHWVIVVGRRETRLTLSEGGVLVPAGRSFVVSLADPIESEREADDRLHLYLPRDRFGALAPELDRVRGEMVDGPLGQLLADYLRMLGDALPGLAAPERNKLGTAIQAMVAACVAPTAERLSDTGGQIDLTRLERVRQVIRRRLHSATLTPAALCREVGMSRSQLYRLLEGEGGVIRYIQRHRLRAVHAALSNPAEERPISLLAEACGFYEPSTFSRTFRREFGVTPSDLRAASRAGEAPGGTWKPSMGADFRSLSDCLRAF